MEMHVRLRHVKTQDREWSCQWDDCPEQKVVFNDVDRLKEHVSRHLNLEYVVCVSRNCERKFRTKRAMKLHFTIAHSAEAETKKCDSTDHVEKLG